jgi:NodT family efflux transporter outer membrane factor (OMF) lipoprotein
MKAAPIALLLLLAGCMVGPDYHKPAAEVPTGYKELAGWTPSRPMDALDRGAWWSVYHDPILDGLERQIDISNQNLKESEAAYRQATALIAEARAGLLPTLSLDGSYTRQQSGGGGTGASSSGFSRSNGAHDSWSLQGSASWDLDVWGRIRRTVESDVANAQASAADLASARLSAEATLAEDYINLRMEDSLQTVLNGTVAAFQRSLQITQNQYTAGTAAQSDVITAETQLQNAQAQAINVGVARAEDEHAIAVLIGKPPSELSLPPQPLMTDVPVVPASLPSTLLQRRPDIAAAERQMQAANAEIGVAVAGYYPDVSLSGLFGFTGNPLGTLISSSNRVWSLGASADETLFNGGLTSAQVRSAEATYDEQVATYRQTVLTAFQQVEDDLASLRILEQEMPVQEAALQSARRAVQITVNEYQAGTVAYTSVVTAQATELGDEQTVLTLRQERLIASIGLIQALGGGWDASQLPSKQAMKQPVF